MNDRPANGIVHGACGQSWTGNGVAHCPACHRNFSSTSGFDRHQQKAEPTRLCRDPQDVGLVAVDKPFGALWAFPGIAGGWWGESVERTDGHASADA